MLVVKKDELKEMIGTQLGVSDWLEVSQEMINQFADVTFDHQFIHVNEEMAKQTPFGGTIAHGFLSLSLLSKLGAGTMPTIEGVAMGVNYGFDKVRLLSPVRAGKRVRGSFKLLGAEEKNPGQVLMKTEVTVEIEGADKPALVAEWLTMQFIQG